MAFTIFIKSDYVEISVFYPYQGWDEDYEGWRDDEDEVERREFMEKCIAVCPRNESEIEELWSEVEDPAKDYLSVEATAVGGSYASIEVDDELIDDLFKGDEYDIPDPEVLIPEIIKSKFCFIKVWENSGGFQYEGDGDFDLDKLTWEKGQFAYDGEEFDFTDGDGNSSYTRFYKDGVEV